MYFTIDAIVICMFSVIVREVSLEKTVVGDCDVSTN